MKPRGAALALLFLLVATGGCAGAPAPAPPPPAPAPPPPPPEPRELESPLDPQRAEELRSEAGAALAETRKILAGLEPATRRERAEAVATIESLVEQGRAALGQGEVERAHNLAAKALGLAREL